MSAGKGNGEADVAGAPAGRDGPSSVQRSGGPKDPGALSQNTEIQAEQAVVDHAYERLEAMRNEARALADDVLDQGEGGTFANRVERDVRMEARGRRLADLQVG